MDGSILVVDASHGIQTQTNTVWNQAEKFHVPRVIFLNKMDLSSSSTDLTCTQIKKNFNAIPLLLQLPLFSNGYLYGFVDLIKMRVLKYTDSMGNLMDIHDVNTLDSATQEMAKKANNELLETLGSLDDDFAEKFMNNKATHNDIMLTIRKLTVRMQAFPVLCGSALKNRGIQPVLDAIINFLPSPAEAPDAEGVFQSKPVFRSHKDKKLLFV